MFKVSPLCLLLLWTIFGYSDKPQWPRSGLERRPQVLKFGILCCPLSLTGFSVEVPITCSLCTAGSHSWPLWLMNLWSILLAWSTSYRCPLLPQPYLSSCCHYWLLWLSIVSFCCPCFLPPFLPLSYLHLSSALTFLEYMLCARPCIRHMESRDKIPVFLEPAF